MASTIIGNRDRSPLTRDQIQRGAPTVYADQPHESRSARYLFVSTEGMLDALMEIGWHPVQVIAQVPRRADRREYAKHEIRLTHPDHAIDMSLATRDGVHVVDRANPLSTGMEMVFTNSHDGSSATSLSLGLFKLVCRNGLIVSDGTIDGYHVRHSNKWKDEIIEGTYRVIEQTDRVRDGIGRMAGTELPEPQRQLLAAHAANLRWPDGAPVQPERLLQPRRREDIGADAWRTLNVLQEHVIRGNDAYVAGEGRNRRYMHTRPITGIDDGQRINRDLWSAVHTLTTQSPADFAEMVMKQLAPADQDALLARMRS